MKITSHVSNLERLVRFGGKGAAWLFCFTLIAGLALGWLISGPLLKLADKLALAKKHRGNNQRVNAALGKSTIVRRAMQIILWIFMFCLLKVSQAESLMPSANFAIPTCECSNTNIWESGIGEKFRAGTQSISLSTGAGYGEKILGSKESHDLALVGISYGQVIGSVEGEGHWYRGNWEVRGELFSGAEFSPVEEWLVGVAPHLRYNFTTGTRWIPYVDVGAGLSATSIGPPDLSHYFEFNLQAASGIRWFFRENLALGLEARFLHMSCAGISSPNLGLNNVNGMVGITWFF